MEKAKLVVQIKTAKGSGLYYQVVKMEIPKVAAELIREAWTMEGELQQRTAIHSEYLAKNQSANATLWIDDEPVAGIKGMSNTDGFEGVCRLINDK